MLSRLNKVIYLLLISMLLLVTVGPVLAYVMESTNYRIQQDSINIGGTDDASSSSYMIKDTVGEVGTGKSSSSSYNLYAGYRQMNEVSLSVSSPSDVELAPSIPGITGGAGSGSAAWTVITDNPAGYSLTIKASSSPALIFGSNSFADYTPSGSDPDFTWSVAASDAEFGFTPEGADIVQKYKDNGSACNAGSSDTADRCWYYLSTAAETIAQSASANHPSGAATTVKFQAESGSGHFQLEGTYTATTTVTAVTL